MDGGTSAGRKPSLFAQRMKNAKESKKIKKHSGGGDVERVKKPAPCFGERSYVVSGPDADQIHKENIERLSTMAAEEIEAERNKLITEMDPKLLDFLRSRKSKRNLTSHSDNKMSEETSMSTASKSDETMDTENVVSETAAHDLSKRWPNLGTLEDEKLKWMEQLPKSTPPQTDIPYNARFSFDGTLLPYSDENLDVRQGLHHHGEEPERPGYTLQELIQLSRSSVLQQRIIALNTLANVMVKANLYEECLDKPLVPLLLDAELFLMLRFSLDDASKPVVTASLAALTNLIVNHSDEICLDNLIGLSGGLHQPSLNTVISIPPNELAELKDPELLRLDLIRGALRTHLLHRFRYILDKMNPDETDIVNVLKCLIRIARHSVGAVEAISDCVGLLESVERLLRKDSGHYYPDAMKLLRVFACRSEHFAFHVFNNMSVMDTIQDILAGNAKEKQPEALRLMLESFYMWQTLLTYNLSTDHISIFTPVLSRLLCVHIEHTDMESSIGDQEHGVALLSTLAIVFRLRHHMMQQFVQPVILVARKWVSQLTSRTSFTRPMCKLVGTALKCVAEIVKHEAASESDIEMKLEKFFQSSLYTEAISLLRKHSWLLQSDGDRSKGMGADNLPSLGRAPCTLHVECPQPLFEGLVAFVIASNKPALSMSLLRNQSWESYLGALTRRKRLCEIASHWYARQEIKLISALLCSNLNCQAIEPGLFHHVALVMTTVIHKEDQLLLREIIQTTVFNKEYFLSHITSLTAQINHLTVEESRDSTDNTTTQSVLLEAVNNIDDIKNCYSTHLRLHEMIVPNRPPSTLTASEENGSEPILPSDWQFLPILNLYNNEGRARDPDKLAKFSLEWVLIVENFHPEFAKVTPICARFSRLCCLFLAGADVYRSVGGLLKELLKVLLSNEETMDLDGPVPGLNSFYDFYRQLVDHFLAVSYGDPVFGQYVLVPLLQKFNVRFRKLIWSEQVPLVRVLSTPIEQLVMGIEEFLEPCETDTQLLATYLQYLGTGRVRKQWSPVLYRVAVHHVATFIVRYPDYNFTKSLLHGINTLGNQELRSLLLEYNTRRELME